MSNIDYSKWKNIEISDDEDDTHPNIDTPSLFRWRHRARVDRMEEQKVKEQKLNTEIKKHKEKLSDVKDKMAQADTKDLESLESKLTQLQMEEKQLIVRKTELDEEKKKTPLNVDTINKEKSSRTVFASVEKYKPKELTDEEKAVSLETFRKDYMPLVKEFGFLRRSRDSEKYLCEHSHLICEEACNLLVIWCIDLATEQSFDLMEHVAHQVIALQFIIQLAIQLERDPRECARPFFKKYDNMNTDSKLELYKQSFDEELQAFIKRIRNRALQRIEEAKEEDYEEKTLEKGEMLGPGGLDPAEVFETLPLELQRCFESRDVDSLSAVIASMNPEDAEYHLKRCVDSGLWVTHSDQSE